MTDDVRERRAICAYMCVCVCVFSQELMVSLHVYMEIQVWHAVCLSHQQKDRYLNTSLSLSYTHTHTHTHTHFSVCLSALSSVFGHVCPVFVLYWRVIKRKDIFNLCIKVIYIYIYIYIYTVYSVCVYIYLHQHYYL